MTIRGIRAAAAAPAMALTALATLVVPGCATGPGYVSSLDQQTRTLTFMSTDDAGQAVTREDIIEGLEVSIPLSSNFEIIRGYMTRSVLSNNVQHNQQGVSAAYNEKSGDFEMYYSKLTQQAGSSYVGGSNIVVPFDMSITPGAETTTVALTNQQTVNETMLIAMNPLTSKANAEADAVSAVMNGEVYIPRQQVIDGEFDSPYPDNAVYANYERILGEYSAETAPEYYAQIDTVLELEKGNIFVIAKDDFDHLVQVSVFPYRNGSKVTYKFIYTFGLTGDGGSTYNANDIQSIIAEIQNVAND